VLYHLWDLGLARNLVLTAGVMVVLSVGSEVVQAFVPYRTFDTNDILANLVGSLLGVAMAVGFETGKRWWQEHRRRVGGASSQVRYVGLSSEDDVLELV